VAYPTRLTVVRSSAVAAASVVGIALTTLVGPVVALAAAVTPIHDYINSGGREPLP
jgi:hypothetical protein